MASPSLNLHQGGGHLPPSTLPPPMPSPLNGRGLGSRPPSEPRSATSNSEVRASQPPMQSPLGPQAGAEGRTPTPVAGTQSQKPNGEAKTVGSTAEYNQLSSLLKATKPEVVRQVVRDHWQRCLSGSDFHVGFILNTTLHHANPHLLDQAVKDFGAKLVSSTKHNLVEHLTTADVDDVADALFQRASDRFLDRALARRFETISGRALVNALARAERLGYDTRDIVEEKAANQPESVIPSSHPPAPGSYPSHGAPISHYPQHAHPSQYQQQPPQPQYRGPPPPPAPVYVVSHPNAAQAEAVKPWGIEFCSKCGRACSGLKALDYHLKKKGCFNHVIKLERLGADTCVHCGVMFNSAGGLAYHNKSDVCGAYNDNVRSKMMELLAERSHIPAPKPSPVQQQVPSQPMTPAYHHPSQPAMSHSLAKPDLADQIAYLSPERQRQFDEEMKAAEDMYGQQMKDAMALPQPQSDMEMSKIKNRLNSRQSTLRKKYGIKLRERRTRAQIDADNMRIANSSPASTPPTSQLSSSLKRPLSSHNDSPRKRMPLSQMSGLSGAAASAEMTDPTLNMAASRARASHQGAPVALVGGGSAPADPIAIDSVETASEGAQGSDRASTDDVQMEHGRSPGNAT